MDSIENLKEEHEDIAVFLAILEQIINRLESGKGTEMNSEDMEWLFEFNRDFILKSHHEKEEHLLFPAMRELGVPEAPVNVLISEHDLMRDIAKTVRGLIEDYKAGNSEAASKLIETVRIYIQLMKDHIENEESIFYSMVDQYISKERDARLAYRLWLFGEERIGVGRLAELHELLDNLKIFYGISRE